MITLARAWFQLGAVSGVERRDRGAADVALRVRAVGAVVVAAGAGKRAPALWARHPVVYSLEQLEEVKLVWQVHWKCEPVD